MKAALGIGFVTRLMVNQNDQVETGIQKTGQR